MTTYRGSIAVYLLLATTQISAAQSDKTADRKEIEGDYARSSRGMKQKDTQPMFAVMTENATFKDADGNSISRPQFESMMKRIFVTMTYTRVTPQITKWVWQDKAALLDVTTRSAGMMKTPDGKTHAVTFVSKSRDQWVKLADGWRLKQIEAVSEAMTQDGKPVVMPTPTPKK